MTSTKGRTLCRASPVLAVIFVSATALSDAPMQSATLGDTLDEVIVTARKVEESLQDVPMSVQVLSAEFLDQADVTHLYELQFNIPGLVLNNVGLFGAGFALRGVGDQGGTALSIATHLDGVYLGRANLAIVRMFDLERIEVLKGPQGTLYGRNATGGSINFITQAPQDELDAEIEAAYGSYDTFRAQGHLNVPLGKSAFRLAFIGSEGDGYIQNSIDDRTFGESDFWGLRAALRVSATDNLLVDFMAQHVVDDGEAGELWLPPPQFLVNPDDIRLTTVTLENPFLVSKSDNASINAEYDLGFAMLRSITGYLRSDVRDLDDCSGRPEFQGCVRSGDPVRYEQWSQEVQLASRGNARVDWLMGANYVNGDGLIRFFNIVPLLNPLPRSNYVATSDETAYALFGQATLHLASQWSVTGGLRLSHEDSSASDIGTGALDNPTLTTAENDEGNASWRADVEYAATEYLLAYAGISTGFKSGGVTTDRLPTGEFDDFESENLIAFEAGVNSQWPEQGLTLNGAAFYYDFDDMQISSIFIHDGNFVSDIENSAKVEIYGLDINGTFQINERLTLSGALVWMPKREFVEFTSEWTGDELSGNTMSRAPEWSSTTAIDYEHPLRDFGSLSVRLEYNYRSEFFFTKENDPWLAQDSFGLLNLLLDFKPAEAKWHVFAAGRNLTDTDYFNQILIQSSPGYPATWEVGFAINF